MLFTYAFLLATSDAWQSVTVDNDATGPVRFIGTSADGRLCFVLGTSLWQVERAPARTIRVGFDQIKGECTAGLIVGTRALLLYQEFRPNLPVVSADANMVEVNLATGLVSVRSLSHIFGPAKDGEGGQDVGHVVLSLRGGRADTRQNIVDLLWMTWRGTVAQSEFAVEMLNAKTVLEDFGSAWKKRVTLWRTPLPLINAPLPVDCARDSKTCYVLVQYVDPDPAFAVVPYDSMHRASDFRFSPAVKEPRLADLGNRVALVGLSLSKMQFVAYAPDGKELVRLHTPAGVTNPVYAGCTDGIVAIAQPMERKTVVFWRRVSE